MHHLKQLIKSAETNRASDKAGVFIILLFLLALPHPASAESYAMVLDSEDGTIHMIEGVSDISHGPFLKGLLEAGLEDVVVTQDGNLALISSFQSRRIYFINISNPLEPQILSSIYLPEINPEDLAISPDGRYALVTDGYASGKNLIYVIDIKKMKITGSLDTGSYQAHAVTIAPDNETVIAIDSTNNVAIVLRLNSEGILTGPLGSPIPINSDARNIEIAPDGKTVFILHTQDFNITLLLIEEPLKVSKIGVFECQLCAAREPHSIAFYADIAYVLGVHNGISILKINSPGNVSYTGISIPQQEITQPMLGVDGITISDDGTKAYTAKNSYKTTSIFDLKTNTYKGKVFVGNFPTGIAFIPNKAKTSITLQKQKQIPVLTYIAVSVLIATLIIVGYVITRKKR